MPEEGLEPRHADYDSARFPSVYRRFSRFWTANWTVLSADMHTTCLSGTPRAGAFHGTFSDDRRLDGDSVVLAAGLKLVVVGQDRTDIAGRAEVNGGR